MKISEINSLDDIQKYEKISNLKQDIQKLISPLQINTNTDEELFSVIQLLKNKWLDLVDGPFISEQEKYIFYLTKLEGKQRNKAIGLTDEHYEDKKLAKIWRNTLAKKVASDAGGSDKAFQILQDIYNVVIDDDFEDEHE